MLDYTVFMDSIDIYNTVKILSDYLVSYKLRMGNQIDWRQIVTVRSKK